MILANVRHQLGRDDAQLVLRLLARGSDAELRTAEGRLRDEGIDALLDDPRLLAGLTEARQASHASFPLFAYVMVRHALRSVGEDDRVLADYVAAILLHFGLQSRTKRIGDADDESYDTIADLCEDLDDPDARRSFLVRAHLGNYALWLSGLFPEFLTARKHRRGAPDLAYYEEMGQRGYRLAADHRLAEQHGLTSLFSIAADRFVLLRIALNSLSDGLLFPNRVSADRLLRQVANEAWLKQSS